MRFVKKFSLITFLLILSLCFHFVGLNSVAAADKVYNLKMASAWPIGDYVTNNMKVFAKSAEKRSNGRLKISVFAEGELVPGTDLYMASKIGTVDIAAGGGSMWGSVIPISLVEFGLPGAFVNPDATSYIENAEAVINFFYSYGFIDLLRDEYQKKGIYYLGVMPFGELIALSTKPVTNCADLKGKIIRTGGPLIQYNEGAGLSATSVSPMETYMALKMGTVDMANFDIGAITGLKWHEVAPYLVKGMGDSLNMGGTILRQKLWDSLSDDLKFALKGAQRDFINAMLDSYVRDYKVVDKMIEKGEVKVNTLDDACQAKFIESADNLWIEFSKKSPEIARAIELIKEWRGLK